MQDLEEQQAQLSKDKEDLARQLALLQASAAHEREAAAQRDADNAAHAEEFAASSALLASLVRTAQVVHGLESSSCMIRSNVFL